MNIDPRLTVESLKAILNGLPNVIVESFVIVLANGVKISKEGKEGDSNGRK